MAKKRKIFSCGVALAVAGLLYVVLAPVFRAATVLHDLLLENKALKQAITNLTDEGKIGYAKVLSQQTDANGLVTSTRVKFVETSRDDELKTVLSREYTVEGDIVHFDALIVKFGNRMVMDGRRKSLYIWRRIYGEKMAPENGYQIEEKGQQPKRYEDLLKALPIKDRDLFWSEIWNLANDPYRLRDYDIEAVYGNVTYAKLRKGLVYIFRITATGQVYPEVIPDI